jgi:hypothetical protein
MGAAGSFMTKGCLKNTINWGTKEATYTSSLSIERSNIYQE